MGDNSFHELYSYMIIKINQYMAKGCMAIGRVSSQGAAVSN